MNLTLYNEIELDNWLTRNWDKEDLTDEDRNNLVKELIVRQTASIDKVNNMLKFLTHTEGFAETCKKEIARIEQRKSSAENLISRIKNGLKDYMILKKLDKLAAGTYKVSLRSSDSVEITNESLIPSKYKTVEIKVSKSNIKDDMKKGNKIPGAQLKKSNFIQIR